MSKEIQTGLPAMYINDILYFLGSHKAMLIKNFR